MLQFDYNLPKIRLLGKKNPKTVQRLSLAFMQNLMDNRSPGSNELTITYCSSIQVLLNFVNNYFYIF
ncbi:hypothetical protein DA797_01600 [Limosilactobacillus reuteri]|uniref:Integrase n=1 Tax=Limosilactobacillus reuteri TaxID=1598 RepID=A0ABD6XF28_LIMRT|nr:hypothetical protein DA797_01600 [Limosilactobacillus reuteri]PTM30194.1 hypothetical protein DA796_02985 [Limosilactobacillus reuteri]